MSPLLRAALLLVALSLCGLVIFLVRGPGAHEVGLGPAAGRPTGSGAGYAPAGEPLAGTRIADGGAHGGAGDAAPGVHGRVLLADGRHGLPALDVALLADGRRAQRTRTGVDGRFAFEPEHASALLVRVEPDPRWNVREPVRLATEAQARGAAPLLFLADAAQQVPLVGVVRDARTGEPCPAFLLFVWDALGQDERFLTDEAGRFTSAMDFGVGRLAFLLHDIEGAPGRYAWRRLQHADLHEELTLGVEVGPTYRVALEPPSGYRVNDFFVEVCAAGEGPRALDLDDHLRTRLRAGEPPWARLAPAEVSASAGSEPVLWLVSEDGLWTGRAPVDSVLGVVAEVVTPTLVLGGTLRGRVEDGLGEAVPGARLAWVASGGARTHTTSGPDAYFRFRGLPPGDGRLVVQARAHEPADEALALVPGEDLPRDVVLERLPAVGDIAGALSSASGGAWSGGKVTLDKDGFRQSAAVRDLVVDGRWRGEFRFADLPAGEYELRFHQSALNAPVEGPARVSPPLDGVALVVRDGGVARDLAFRVVDAKSGQPLDFEAWLDGPLLARHLNGARAGSDVHVRAVPADAAFHWSLRAPGYAPAHGDAQAFVRDGERWVADVRLQPGWGAILRLWDVDGGAPVAGVAIELDGVRHGPSDAAGRIAVGLEQQPRRVALPGGGWLLAQSPDVSADGVLLPSGSWAGLALYLHRIEGARNPDGGER